MLHMLCSAGKVICEVRESHRYSFRWREIGNAKGRLRGTGCQIGAVRVIDRVRSSRWQVSEVTAGESAVEVVTGERDKDGQRSRFSAIQTAVRDLRRRDKRDGREALGRVAESLSAARDLLGEKADVVSIAEEVWRKRPGGKWISDVFIRRAVECTTHPQTWQSPSAAVMGHRRQRARLPRRPRACRA